MSSNSISASISRAGMSTSAFPACLACPRPLASAAAPRHSAFRQRPARRALHRAMNLDHPTNRRLRFARDFLGFIELLRIATGRFHIAHARGGDRPRPPSDPSANPAMHSLRAAASRHPTSLHLQVVESWEMGRGEAHNTPAFPSRQWFGCRRYDLLGLVHNLLRCFILSGLQVGIKKKCMACSSCPRIYIAPDFCVRPPISSSPGYPPATIRAGRKCATAYGPRAPTTTQFRIGAGGSQPDRRHMRRIAGMNNVVRQAGMIGLLLEQRDENRDRLLSIGRATYRPEAALPAAIMRRMRPPPGRRDIADRNSPSRPNRQ